MNKESVSLLDFRVKRQAHHVDYLGPGDRRKSNMMGREMIPIHCSTATTPF